MSIERVERLSVDEFHRHYMVRRQPVVLCDAVDDWPALRRWTPEYLKEKWGDRLIDHRGITGTLTEILDRAAASRTESPAPYLKNYNIAEHFTELVADVSPRLRYAVPNWFDSRLLPDLVRVPGIGYELFIGGNGSHIARLHYDEYAVHNFITQVYGTKEFWFYPPEATEQLYPQEANRYLSSVVDPRRPDLNQFPRFAEIEPIKLLLNPGETVFVAPDWWHWTQMPELSISVGTNCANSSNWSQYAREFTTSLGRDARLKWRIMRAYLSVYGTMKRLISRS